MTAKMYALVENAKPAKPLSGQKKIVFDELKRNKNPRLASEINDAIDTSKYNTRQDPFRVTLYYILVFKKEGLVFATEKNFADAEIENAFAGLCQ